MFKFLKVAAMLAIVPVLAVISNPAFAASPGQLAGGDNYVVKNVTQGGAYANSISAACNDEVKYSMQLSNTQFGALDNVTLKVTLPSAGGVSTATATTNLGGQSGTSDTATVNLTSGANQALVNGTTVLYDGNGNVIKTLGNNVTAGGENIGTIEGSTTKFVNFKAKVNCETPPCPEGTTGTPPNCVEPPKKNVVCDALNAEVIGSTNVPAKIKFTAKATATGGATISGYVFDFGDDAKQETTSATVEHIYNKEGDYKATVQVKSSLGTTAVAANCSVTIKVTKEKPPVVVPPVVTPPSTTVPTELPATGPEAAFVGLFGTSALGFGVQKWLVSRRNLRDLLNR